MTERSPPDHACRSYPGGGHLTYTGAPWPLPSQQSRDPFPRPRNVTFGKPNAESSIQMPAFSGERHQNGYTHSGGAAGGPLKGAIFGDMRTHTAFDVRHRGTRGEQRAHPTARAPPSPAISPAT